MRKVLKVRPSWQELGIIMRKGRQKPNLSVWTIKITDKGIV